MPVTETFTIGDVVRYEESGQWMTVCGLHDPSHGDNWVECRWFDGKRFLQGRFCPDEITLIREA